MTTKQAHDVIRWHALDGLAKDLANLHSEVEELRDELAPKRRTLLDVPAHARQVREYLEALDAIGWHSADQQARSDAVAV